MLEQGKKYRIKGTNYIFYLGKNKNIIDQLRLAINYKEKLEILKNFEITEATNLF